MEEKKKHTTSTPGPSIYIYKLPPPPPPIAFIQCLALFCNVLSQPFPRFRGRKFFTITENLCASSDDAAPEKFFFHSPSLEVLPVLYAQITAQGTMKYNDSIYIIKISFIDYIRIYANYILDWNWSSVTPSPIAAVDDTPPVIVLRMLSTYSAPDHF